MLLIHHLIELILFLNLFNFMMLLILFDPKNLQICVIYFELLKKYQMELFC